MKNIIIITVATLLIGCGCKTATVPAQPGWKIITNTSEEADNLRQMTGNDMNHTGKVVEVTAPTFIGGSR